MGKTPLICGYEPLEGPYICVKPNNHMVVGDTDHFYVLIQEYLETMDRDGGE